MRGGVAILTAVAMLAMCACSSREASSHRVDQSKLSAELEARAKVIEQRADQAAATAERQAADELAALNAEAARAAVPSPAQPSATQR